MFIEPSGLSVEKSSNKASGSIAPPGDLKQDDNTDKQNLTATPTPDTKKKGSTGRTSTVESIKGSSLDAKLKKHEIEMEQHIKSKLDSFYTPDSELYYRLAPANAPQRCVRNDSERSGVVHDATMIFLNDSRTRSSIEKVVKRLTWPITVM